MSNGPITIFDKSAIQALSIDEAALFGQFYRTVITPLFFVETLADLEKEVALGKTPEQIVGMIASKTANLTGYANAHHARLVAADLLGQDIEMRGRPHVVGGRPVVSDGHRGIVFDEAPEAEAFHRWQRHQFVEIERRIAKGWREALNRQRIRRMNVQEMFRNVPRPRTLAQVKRHADVFMQTQGGRPFLSALNVMRVPRAPRGHIFLRWLDSGCPSIADFAPYAAYIATVQLFFQLAVSLDLISGDRPSNAADIAYLYYLPFCQVFTSSDKLHMKTVPLFMRPDQVFVPGADLKADLKRLDTYFSAQPQEILDRGVMFFAPPYDGDYLTTALWKQFLPGWRDRRGDPGDVKLSPEKEKALLEEFRQAIEAPEGPPIDGDDAEFIALHHVYPVHMGKWRIVAEDVAERSRAHQEEKRRATTRPSADP